MECHPPQNNETEIMENNIHRDEDDPEERFLSHEELGEYKKIQEVFLTFLKKKPKNKSDLRKFLFNIAASLMRLLEILEDIPNQESSDCRVKNSKTNHKCDEYNKSSTEDQSIPKKINRHLGQKNDRKYEQIPKVTISKVCNNNKPAYVGYTDRSLYENDECRTNTKKSDSRSSQCIQFLPENDTQTILQTHEICNTQKNNETEIVFECKNVEPTITSFALQKSEYMSENQLQYSEIANATLSTIKDERLDMVKKEYLDENIEKLNSNNDCETNGQNGIIPPLNSIHDSEESEKLETCSKKLEKKSNLKVHKDTMHDHITHSCEICGKKFMQKHKLEIHTEVVHSGRKLYRCNTCGKTDMTKKILDRHVKSLHKGITHAYDSCGEIFAQEDYLKNHINSVHNGKKSHDRGTRGKALRQKVALKEHIESPRRGITHTCDPCGKTFTRKSSLKNHIDFLHKNLKHHKCGRCPKEFSSKRGLDFHISTVHNGITYSCDYCEKIFTRKGYLRIHINIVHMGNGKLSKCDDCQKSFNYKCDLTAHIDDVHKGIAHPCDLCEKVFRLKASLKLHKDSVHNGISHPCDLCEKVFSQKGYLKLHKDSVHNGISHPCDLCEKVFSTKKNLKVHKDSVHKGITYPCDLCRKVFTRKRNLKVHKYSLHKGITHPCDQCKKSYITKTYLKLHIDRIHNGKKPNT